MSTAIRTTSTTDLPKTYDPAIIEAEALRAWNREHAFHAEPTDPGDPYSIVIPPPNVTAALHLGHALNNTIQDILTRWHRMLGDNACWLPGTDHAGIATQTVVEKRVLREEGKRRTDFGRDEFVAKVQAWKDEYEKKITDQLKAMGCSCDFDRQAFTMDEPRAKAVREAFFRLFKDGLIYRGKRLVNWDPVTQTALADDEVEMEEVDGYFYYLRYPLSGTDPSGTGILPVSESARSRDGSTPDITPRHGQDARATGESATYVTVATTRPETMLGDTAVAINPKDPRAASLRGKRILLPIVNREIPIVEDDYVVMPVKYGGDENDAKAQFATGFLKVTPAHDPNDYDIGRRHDLPMINVMGPDAAISDRHGWPAEDFSKADPFLREQLVGKSREDARKLVVDWFERNGLLEEVKPYKHSVGHSYRSHVPIEPWLSDQWYCKVTDPRLAGAALRAMAPDQRDGMSRDRQGQGAVPKGTDKPQAGAGGMAGIPLAHARGSSPDSPPEALFIPDAITSSPDIYPLAYFITFSTYGTWLHGNDRGSADRDHNVFGTPYLVGDEDRERREFDQLKHPPASLDETRRRVVRDTIAEVCRHRGWPLHVAHVRPKHVHVVVSARATPEKVMNDFKAYATRRLREAGLAAADERLWTRHGSTRYLFTDDALAGASQYVHDRQGAPIEPPPLVGADLEDQMSRERERAGPRSPHAAPRTGGPLPDGRGSFPSQFGWEGQLRFYPARYAKTFQLWHENLRDWSISRQLWWGHRIPVWTSSSCAYDDAEIAFDRFVRTGRAAIQALASGTDEIPAVCVRDNDPELLAQLAILDFVQDPDVLDTWFSSALWPMSTLDWPDESAIRDPQSALNTWNPSNVLTTAREIITLWVSRMVMFNLYFRDCLPFRDVFIHAMIQDGEGQKMSKSLGNGVDPNDIIERHGADAMRFTLTSMTTHTQDVRMPVDLVDPHSGQTFQPEKITTPAGYVVAAPVQKSPADPGKTMVSSYGVTVGAAKPTPEMPLAKNTSAKFDEGRKFCNKIWQVALHFAMNNLAKIAPEPVDEQKWSMADRWIVSRLNRTVAEADEALKAYRFDQYAKACYDFFWRDFCDWYVETIKPALRDPARAGQTANVLAAVLDASLRLMHPMMPFITEVLWWKLNEVRPQPRELPGRIAAGRDSARLVKASWPAVGDFSEAAEHIFPRLQEVVGAIRTARNQYNVSPKRKVTVSVMAPGDSARQITGNREMIELLATCALKDARPDLPPVEKAARATAAGCEIYVEGLVDETAEKQRNAKRREELQKQIAAMRGRLGNESYVAKAPPHLVKQTQDQLADAEAELAKLA